ncbi:hypothetical protein DV735_g4117, partial [Chaetothyriales sp. CBS 134920]
MPVTRVPVIRNPKYVPNGLKSYIYTLNKYNIKPRAGSLITRNAQNKLVRKETDGSLHQVTADDQQNDAYYISPVQIGTPAQTVHLDFDSGSSDLWVWSTELSKSTLAKGEKNGITVFDPSKSSTYKKQTGSTWQITYGDQSSASGDVGTDNVTIGDITIKAQAVELAQKLSSQFESSASSGLLGLAFGNINTVKPTPVKTPVENMIAQDSIPENAELFTVYLSSVKDVSDPDQGKSFYTFGAIDTSVIPKGKEISYTPVDNSEGFWLFDSPSATVNGETISLSGNKAIADTGTTLILASTDFCEAVYKNIPGAKLDNEVGGYTFPANTPASSLPVVTVSVGDTQFTINKEHLSFAATDDTGSTLYGGIQDRGTSLDFDILGDVFLKNVYAVFDVGNTRFGAVQRDDPTPDGPSSSS